MESIFGSVFFEFIGAFIKWLYYLVVNAFRGKKIPGFMSLWIGRKKSNHSDLLMQGVSNIFLGIISTVLLILFLNKIW